MSYQNITSPADCLVSSPAVLPSRLLCLNSQNITCTAYIQSVHHLNCPCPVSQLSLLHISSCYTISPTHGMLVHHLSWLNPVNTPALLPMPSHNRTSHAHVQLEYHLSYQCQYTISTALVQSLLPLYSPCPDSTPSLQPIPNHSIPTL